MKPATKEKTWQPGPSRSYPKTRVRASRLYQAAFILAIVELTRRLHPAYEQAYDKHAVGSVLPQKPAPTPPPTDCQRFADIVDEIADAVFVNNNNSSTNSFPHNVNYFMDRLAQRFTGMRSATIWSAALQGGAGHTPVAGFNGNEFGSSGFRQQFYERPPGNNQVRHATGGLIAGYSGIGLERMNARENPNDPRGRNDINLNNQTVPMGTRLAGGGNESTQRLARGLGQWIRDTLCGP